MKNLHVIFTTHICYGACNADALHEIIQLIEPDLIFEELSLSNFDDFYNKRSRHSLETDAIKKYLRNHSVKHVPVDTFPLPENYEAQTDYLFDILINKSNLEESLKLSNLIHDLMERKSIGGFHFLNSEANNTFFEKFELLKDQILHKLNDSKLFAIANMDKYIIDKREDEIINNIYNYGRENLYSNALLFIGSGHRKSMMQKIENPAFSKDSEVNWIFHISP